MSNNSDYMMTNALFYLEKHGSMNPLAIFPLKGKVPAISKADGGRGCHDASRDGKQVQTWWSKYKSANIGIATGEVNGIVVIDVDVDQEKGIDGTITLADAEREYGELPDTWTVNTPRGGRHLYYRYPAGKSISIGTDIFADTHGPGIDYRGNGGYVVAPPSMHPDVHKRYMWDLEYNPREHDIADLPARWVEVLSDTEKTISDRFDLPDNIGQGSRNDTLFRFACSLRAKGVKATDLFNQLKEVNRTKCHPPVDAEELQAVYDSAMGYEPGHPDDKSPSSKQTAKEELKIICYDDVEDEEPKFICYPYIPEGKITIIQGDSGVGKTALACGIIAQVTIGGDICGHPIEQGNALILSVEDDAPVLRKRIQASGGDISKVFAIESDGTLTFTDERIEQAIKQVQPKVVLFDPLQAFLGAKVDMFRANETRPILAQLTAIAGKYHTSIIIISHMSKAQNKAIYRALGSVDIIGQSRSALMVGMNPDVDDERAVVQIKCSNAPKGPTLAYTVGDHGKVIWKGTNHLTADDLDRAQTRKDEGLPYDTDPIVYVVRKLIAENDGGLCISIEDFEELFLKTDAIGYKPFKESKDLRRQLEGINRDMIRRDCIQVYMNPTNQRMRGKAFYWNGEIVTPLLSRATTCIIIRKVKPVTDFQTSIHPDEG